MLLLVSFTLASIILSFITIFFTHMAESNPYNWFFMFLFTFGYFAIIITLGWGLLLLFSHKYKHKEYIDPRNNFYKGWTVFYIKFLLLFSWSKFKKKNFNRIPKNTPVLYLFNHTTLLDAYMILNSLYPRHFSMIATSKMKKVPFIGPLATSLGCLYIDQEDPDSFKSNVDTATDFIKNRNSSIVLSPEGFLNRGEELSTFKSGGFKIALNTNCPIVLLHFEGALALAKKKNLLKKVKLSAKVIDVIPPSEYENMNATELAKYTQEIYQNYRK